MVSLIGAHYSRNGIKQFPARVVLSMYSNGLGSGETHPDTIIILRDTRVFPSGEAPPDFHTFDPVASGITWSEYGRYWYSGRTEMTIQPNGTNGFRNFKEAWDAGQPAHYRTICNEQGGGEGNTPAEKEEIRRNVQRTCDIERAIAYAANADGRKCCVGNFAGGSPGDFELWKEIVAPFIVEMWENGGNIYGRHCYSEAFIDANGNVKPGQPQRVIDELKHLQSIGYRGGVVLTECGLDGGYGVADLPRFTYQMQAWEAALRPYSDILIGFCVWECGDTGFHADYTNHLKTLVPYMQNSYLGRWEPAETTQPPDGGGGPTMKTIGPNVQLGGFGGFDVQQVRYRWVTHNGQAVVEGDWIDLALPQGVDLRGIRVQAIIPVCEESENPNPPDVIVLPKGAKGVDLSAYQKGFFSKVSSSKFDFFMFRCSDGMNTSATSNYHDANGVDTALLEFADVGHASGKPWGIYHFLRPGNVEAQISKVRMIHQMLVDRGTPPRAGKFADGLVLAGIWADVEDYSLVNESVKQFIAGVGIVSTTGIYTGKYVWEAVTSGADVWWANKPLWLAAYGANNGQIPPWEAPSIPRGWTAVNIWQYTSEGQLVITEWTGDGLDLNSAGPYTPSVKPPDPPTGATVDMTQYYLPPNGRTYGDISIKSTNWGQGDLRQQLQLHGGYCYVTKGGEIEKRMIWDDRIYFLLDDSPGDGKCYTVNSPTGWIPKTWAVGQTFTRQETTTFYYKATCQPTGEVSNWTNQMLFKALYAEWTSPHGIKLQNVAHLQWLVNGVVEEDYYLAPGLGYAGWKNRHGRESWIKELIPYTDQQPNKFAGGCYHEPIG